MSLILFLIYNMDLVVHSAGDQTFFVSSICLLIKLPLKVIYKLPQLYQLDDQSMEYYVFVMVANSFTYEYINRMKDKF